MKQPKKEINKLPRKPKIKAVVQPSSKNKGGRPTKYNVSYNAQVEKLCKLGATDKEMAAFFEVNEDTFHEWKKVYPKFSESIRAGKQIADANVASSMYHKATGYQHEDVDIKVINNKIVKTKLTKHYPPDTVAAIFWLKNRQKSVWRDKQEIGVTDNEGNDINIGYGKEED